MRRGLPLLLLPAVAIVLALTYDPGLEEGPSLSPEPPASGGDGVPETLSLPSPTGAGATAAPADQLILRGRVLQPDRRPVPGAVVIVRERDGREHRSVTGPDGVYEVAGGSRPADADDELSLHATHKSGVAARTVEVSARRPQVVDLAPLILGPAHALTVRVTYRGEPVVGAAVLALLRYYYRHRSLLGKRVTDSAGECRFAGLPEGSLRFIATTDRTGRGLANIELPEAGAETVEVALPEPRPLRIQVLDGNDGTPVRGATFEVLEPGRPSDGILLPAVALPPTGADGWTEIDGVGFAPDFSLRALREGFQPKHSAGPPRDAESWVIRLPPYRTVTWTVVPGLSPVPPDGAEIRLQVSDGLRNSWQPVRGFMDGNLLHVPQCQYGYVAVYGYAPDGSIADLDYDIKTDGGCEVSFRPPRTVRVRVRDSGGRPMAGVRLYLDVDGASLNAGSKWTDSRGVAIWEKVYGNGAEVKFDGAVLATLDLAKEDGDFDIALEPRREIVVRVTLAGQSGLPRSYTLHIDNQGRRLGITEDPERGELLYGLHPRKGALSASFRLGAEGYHTHWGTIPLGAAGPIVLDVDLVPVSVLSAAVLPRLEGPYASWYDIMLQRWDEDERRWVTAGGGRLGHWRVDKEGLIHSDDLEAGRYRFVHTKSGIASNAVSLAAGDRGRVGLDLSDVAEVSGRVVVPEGFDFGDVRIMIDGFASDLGLWDDGKPGRSVKQKSGRFTFQVPGDREVVLTATHPLLACPEPVRVFGARDNVTLVLVRTTTARLRIEPEPEFYGYEVENPYRSIHPYTDPWKPEHDIRVHLFSGSPPDPLPPRSQLTLSGKDILEFRVKEGTTRNVLLDVPGLVPRILPRVRFGPGVTELGTITFEKGSLLQIHVELRSGWKFERIMAVARTGGPPSCVRKGHSDGLDIAFVSGLGRGTFAVKVTVLMAGLGDAYPFEFERTVSVDGRKGKTIRVEVQ